MTARIVRPALLAGALALAAHGARAQECADELPAVAKPELKSCSWIDLICKQNNKRREDEYRDKARTFSDAFTVEREPDAAQQNVEYRVRGCRGAVVAAEVTPRALQSINLALLAPSGTTVYEHALHSEGRPFLDRSVRLPETGYYTVRASTTAAGKSSSVCTKYDKRQCVAHEQRTTYPLAYTIAFRGSAGVPPITLGDRTDGTITPGQPFARRIALDRNVRATVTVTAAGGARVSGRLERDDGSLVAAQDGEHLSLTVNPAPREATYLLSVAAAGGGAGPTAVSVVVDTTSGGARRLALGQDVTAEFVNLPPSLAGGAAEAARAEWAFQSARPGPVRLTIVPSGMTGLVVTVAVYDQKTEETVLPETRVARATTVPLALKRPGGYLVVVTPVQARTTPEHASAKYTLKVE